MRRLGRQHGLVLFYDFHPQLQPSRPKSRIINTFDGPPTTAWLTRVPAKPTGHSRYTSRCGRPRCAGCHDRPAGKARPKTKRAHKRRSWDVGLNHGLLFHNLTGPARTARFGGASATGMLDSLQGHDCYGDYYDNSDDDDHEEEEMISLPLRQVRGDGDGGDYCNNYCNHKEEGDDMSFYFVKFERELEDEWCVIGEI